jgi:serine/threonine protein kinase
LTSTLVTQDDIDRADEALRAESSDPKLDISDKELANRLVEAEVISRYQCNELLNGRTKFNLGPYVVTDFIGAGGMGEVYKAEHDVMGREVAVKVLPASKSTPEAITSFSREIRTQAKLDHPNLVRAYDAGNDGRVHYLVTEYVPGMDLRRLIRSEGPLNVNQAASVIMFAALGLDYAHQSGLIHRDVKPGNILVTPEGIGKVSDLGLAGFLNEPDGEDPRAGKIVGTADYLSPEQIRNPHDICEASDIYSLGCTLYYAITGKVPFPGGTPASKARRHLEETPWHPRRFNAEINEEFVEIIADMMEKDPALRIQSMTEVVTRLEPWASETAIVPSLHLTKSPWMPPPVPTEVDEQDTHEGEDLRYEGSGQASQATHSVAGQETRVRPPMPPPLPRQPDQRTNHESVIRALCMAVPVALAVGVAVGFAVAMLSRG